MKNSGKIFDENCSICMENFVQGQGVLITPCKHCFHVQCLQDWINSSVKKGLKEQLKNIREKGEGNLSKVGADCPNCNKSILLAPIIEEQEAINELGDVLDLLDSSSHLENSNSRMRYTEENEEIRDSN